MDARTRRRFRLLGEVPEGLQPTLVGGIDGPLDVAVLFGEGGRGGLLLGHPPVEYRPEVDPDRAALARFTR